MKTAIIKTMALLLSLSLLGGCASRRVKNLETQKDTMSMLTYNFTATLNVSAKEAFDYTKLWNTYTVEYAKNYGASTKGLTGVGNYSSGDGTLAGRKIIWNEVVVQYEEPKTVRFAYSGEMRGSITIDLTPKGDQTIYSFTTHMFFLPDNVLARTLKAFLEQGILGDYLDKTITNYLVKDLARMQKMDPDKFKPDHKPVSAVFADAYLTASETFLRTPDQVFKMFNSTSGLKSILPVDKIEPVGDSPVTFAGLGNHYKLTASKGLEKPLTYDLVVIQYDPPREARYYLYAAGVAMEMDMIITPTASGTKALMLFIIDMPDSVEGQALDVLVHTSDIDKEVQKSLTALKNTRTE